MKPAADDEQLAPLSHKLVKLSLRWEATKKASTVPSLLDHAIQKGLVWVKRSSVASRLRNHDPMCRELPIAVPM